MQHLAALPTARSADSASSSNSGDASVDVDASSEQNYTKTRRGRKIAGATCRKVAANKQSNRQGRGSKGGRGRKGGEGQKDRQTDKQTGSNWTPTDSKYVLKYFGETFLS